jgi:hypothetical protein
MTTDALPHTHHAQAGHQPPAAVRAPRDLPIGVAGPPAVASLIYGEIEQKAPGGFAVTTYRDEATLRAAIGNREVYGGIVMKPVVKPNDGRPEATLIVASGGSPMVAQMLTQMGNGIAMQTGAPLHAVDLAPLPPDDPRGTGGSGWVSLPPWCSREPPH